MDRANNGVTWKTVLEVYDTETGEQITKKHVEKGLYIIESKNIKNTYHEYGNTRTIQWFCRTNPQTRIEF